MAMTQFIGEGVF